MIDAVDVAGFGASAVDLVYVLPAYPTPDGSLAKLPIQAHFISSGGQIATAMAGCAALGLRAAFLGLTGNDAHGARIREELARRGVDVSEGTIANAPQPYSVILLAEDQGERIVLWHRDPDAKFTPDDVSRTAPAIARARLLHVDDVDLQASLAAARVAREAGRMITTDIDRVTEHTAELIRVATHPILAEHVPAKLTGEADLVCALRKLRALNDGPLVVTRGAQGAIALEGDTVIEAPGFRVHAVDTTGAGDVFRAGFITALLEGRPLADVLRFANATAASSCTRRGAIAGVPSRAEVEQMLRQA